MEKWQDSDLARRKGGQDVEGRRNKKNVGEESESSVTVKRGFLTRLGVPSFDDVYDDLVDPV